MQLLFIEFNKYVILLLNEHLYSPCKLLIEKIIIIKK